jgi:excisionase family DNA binding protein
MEQTLLSRKQAGERLGVSSQTVSRLIRDGSLVAHRVSERRVMVSEDSLRRYVAERELPKEDGQCLNQEDER